MRGPSRPRPLGSTYRLQLNGTGFVGARRLVGYLHALGIETLYVSPILAAVPGSTHGYDVIDPTRLDPTLGTPSDFEDLLAELDAHGMRLLIDIVPNHMAAHPANRWWWDTLGHGLGARSAGFFDIDWARHGGKVLLANLSVPLGNLIEAHPGEVALDLDDLVLSVGAQRYPLDPASLVGDPGLDEVGALLRRQHYRLAYWRLGRFEGNYRRFFDVDGLVGVRMEDPTVYDATHRYLLALARDGRVAGLRVDHVDGLADPTGYLARLRADVDSGRAEPAALVIEKILGVRESLRSDWPVDGTTGYEFANLATGLFVDHHGAAAIEAFSRRFSGQDVDFAQIELEAKRYVLAELFPGQLDRLTALARRALDEHQPGHDLSIRDLELALGELTASMDVYRTYLRGGRATGADRSRLGSAAARAGEHLAGESGRALEALVDVLLAGGVDSPLAGDVDSRDFGCGAAPGEPVDARVEFALGWQQLTGAVAAKGTEDTACYRFAGLLCAAEVGGTPGAPSVGVDQLHRALASRQRRSPGALNAGSTHDTKRSADVRARLAVLSEIPEEWERLVMRWHRRFRSGIDAAGGPDPTDELFCYQSMVGVWPLSAGRPPSQLKGRVQAAAGKAAREAKRSTNWIDPDQRYERALASFVHRLFADDPLVDELDRLLRRIGPAGATNSLAMVALAVTAPGVPDIYQGTELWECSLMDPDNRRPVDFDERARALLAPTHLGSPGHLPTAEAMRLMTGWKDGRVKLHVTAALLATRRASPDLFSSGRDVPLEAQGPHREQVVAFARRNREAWAITVIPRGVLSIAGPGRFPLGPAVWGATAVKLPEEAPVDYVDVLTGARLSAQRRRLRVGEVLGALPVSVLRSGGTASG